MLQAVGMAAAKDEPLDVEALALRCQGAGLPQGGPGISGLRL